MLLSCPSRSCRAQHINHSVPERILRNDRLEFRWRRSTTLEHLPERSPLLAPVDQADHRAQVSFIEAPDLRQEQNLLLNVGTPDGEASRSSQPRQFSVIGNRLFLQQGVKPDRQRR
jgi:hypothetical protein